MPDPPHQSWNMDLGITCGLTLDYYFRAWTHYDGTMNWVRIRADWEFLIEMDSWIGWGYEILGLGFSEIRQWRGLKLESIDFEIVISDFGPLNQESGSWLYNLHLDFCILEIGSEIWNPDFKLFNWNCKSTFVKWKMELLILHFRIGILGFEWNQISHS